MTLPAALETERAPNEGAQDPGDPQPHHQLLRLPHRQARPLAPHRQVDERGVEAQTAHSSRDQDYSEGDAPKTGDIEEGLSVLLALVLLLDLPLDALEVEDGSPLRVIEAGGPVEEAEYEGEEDHAGDGLEVVTLSIISQTRRCSQSRSSWSRQD